MFLHLSACALLESPGGTPEERLDAAVPGLSVVVAKYTDDLEPIADLVDAASPDLLPLLLPAVPGVREDTIGEGAAGDLFSVVLKSEGALLTGRIEGEGTGFALLVDTREGPSPDVRLRFGEGTITAEAMDDWKPGPPTAIAGTSSLTSAGVTFSVDLRQTSRWDPHHAGAVTAAVRGEGAWDHGPAGHIGTIEPHAVALLVALTAEEADPDLTLAVALAYAPWLARVAPEVRSVVLADARDRLAFGAATDDWLARHGAQWRLLDDPAFAKLLWASPGGEAVVYGALPLAWADSPLSLERYRFSVPSLASMEQLRDDFPFNPDPAVTASERDAASTDRLLYRAADAGMESLCEQKLVSSRVCFAWERDRERGRSLGPVDGAPIPMHLATSVELQLDHRDDEGGFIGDCATATTLAMAAYQAVGLVPLGVGYAGADWYYPTHNFPLWLDTDRFRATQPLPSSKWDADSTWAYVVLPPVDGVEGLTLGWEPDGWARGGSVVGGATAYGALGQRISSGIRLSEVEAWIATSAAGGWPTFGE